MTWEYLHLISHSFPIVLTVTGAAVGVAGWLLGRPELERWALFAFLVAGTFIVPAYLTGLAAADVVGDRTFIQPSEIQRHRTAATLAAVPVVVCAILAGFSFAEPGDRTLRRFVILVGVVAAVSIGFAASLGARIQHGDERTAADCPAAPLVQPPIPLAAAWPLPETWVAPASQDSPEGAPRDSGGAGAGGRRCGGGGTERASTG